MNRLPNRLLANRLLENAAETDPRRAAEAVDALALLLAGQDARAEEVLRLVPGRRAILGGLWQGRAAVFHLALIPQEAEAQAARHEEQKRVHGYMREGPCRVPEPLALLEGGQVAVVERVGGVPLLDAMWQATRDDRPALQARGAVWLATHAAPTLADGPSNRGPWRKWAAAGVDRQTHDRLKPLETRILQKMHALARQMRAVKTWRCALGHGDFHPNNLLQDGDTTWGIDLGASTRAPVCRDIARFLVHAARRGMIPSGQRKFGVDAGGIAAFAEAFSLTQQELDGDLPFFICHELLSRVEHPDMPQKRITHTVALSRALLQDLKALV